MHRFHGCCFPDDPGNFQLSAVWPCCCYNLGPAGVMLEYRANLPHLNRVQLSSSTLPFHETLLLSQAYCRHAQEQQQVRLFVYLADACNKASLRNVAIDIGEQSCWLIYFHACLTFPESTSNRQLIDTVLPWDCSPAHEQRCKCSLPKLFASVCCK